MLEETEYGRIPVFATGVTLITAAAVEKFGSEEQKQSVLGSVCAGHPKSIAMSEPGAGSDVGSLVTRGRRTSAGWVLNGQKTRITAAHHANEVPVVARTGDGSRKHDGLSMFLVPAGAPGVEIRPIPTMGGREVNDVFMTDIERDESALVGAEGQAWHQLMAGLNFERLVGAAAMVGLARRAFEDTLAYVKERKQFGKPIGSFQALKHRIADLATELECTRLLTHDIALRAEANPEHQLPREASMAKLKASELARRITLDGMQMMGGAGYATEYGMEHLVRKALPMTSTRGPARSSARSSGRPSDCESGEESDRRRRRSSTGTPAQLPASGALIRSWRRRSHR